MCFLQAFQLLEDMAAEGVRPDSAVVTALISACGTQEHRATARKVYDLCAAQVSVSTC
jgi:hypothetical protein